ncbi:MAG TPA: DUF4197 domain-containing protein [Bacteroidia bacterium]|nr:DUF4197 domain-containing protein [Bacteroidia bacterium]
MKKLAVYLFAGSILLIACKDLQKLANDANKTLGQNGVGAAPLTNLDAVKGLKEALTQGTNKSTNQASQTDGFFKNARLFIPFPPVAQKVKDNAIKLGMQAQVTKFEETLNRAAEEATKSAAPVFINAITSMTIGDGLGILRGSDTAATNYLRVKCTDSLKLRFKPIVAKATQKVELTKHWNPLATAYNKIPFVTPINPDLDAYVCERAINGLFLLIGDEEKNIRTNPLARGTEILKKVFGSKENPHNK